MANDPQSRFEQDQQIDPRIDSPSREGLTGTARGDIYEPTRDPEQPGPRSRVDATDSVVTHFHRQHTVLVAHRDP